jgi:biotin carboxyl carrier protein
MLALARSWVRLPLLCTIPALDAGTDESERMRYFVTLEGQEFALTLRDDDAAGRGAIGLGSDPTGAVQTEILSKGRPGRPALVRVDGQLFRVTLDRALPAGGPAVPAAGRATINGQNFSVAIETELERRARPIRDKSVARNTHILAPMPGRIVKISVRPGELVQSGQSLLSIEAMKMENELQAPNSGRVTQLRVEVGATVEADQELMLIEPEKTTP